MRHEPIPERLMFKVAQSQTDTLDAPCGVGAGSFGTMITITIITTRKRGGSG